MTPKPPTIRFALAPWALHNRACRDTRLGGVLEPVLTNAMKHGKTRGSRETRTWRPGFTLIELLVVIVILGVVAGLTLHAVGPLTGSVRNAAVVNEINQLDGALMKYRGRYGQFPPTLLANSSAASPSFDQNILLTQVFVRQVRRMFPRFHGQFSDVDTAIRAATVPLHPGYLTGCDLWNLDAAESLVFWLGGMPQIVWATDTRYEVELTGFSTDPTAPFLSKADQPRRTEVLFGFDHRRLVDSDQDGWPEYVPDFDHADSATPPFVYFDAGSYGYLPSYPVEWHPAMATGVDNWGFARPYLVDYTPEVASDPQAHPRPTDFARNDTFQLLCAGADRTYSQLDSVSGATLNEAKNQLTVYPRGEFTIRTVNAWHPIALAQYDNLTNFLDSTLEQAFRGLTR